MSTPDGEPMIGAEDVEPERFDEREAFIAWNAPRFAADTDAMKTVLKEYLVLLMFEHGEDEWKTDYYRLCWAAEEAAKKEYRSSKIVTKASAP